MPAKPKATAKDSTANLGFEAKLWLTADKLRNNVDAADYKHVVLKTTEDNSDTSEETMTRLVAELHSQFAEFFKLEQATKANLRRLVYGG